MKDTAKLVLPPRPEGGAVVQVKRNDGALRLGRTCQRQAGGAGALTHGGNKAGQVQYAAALLAKNARRVKVLGADGAAHLAGAVVIHPRAARAKARVRNVKLVPHAPGAVRFDLGPLVLDVPLAQLRLKEGRNGAALHKPCKHLGAQSQGRGDVQHIGFRRGALQRERRRGVHRLPPQRRKPHPHAAHRHNVHGGMV